MSVWMLGGLIAIGLLALLLEGFLPAGGLIGIGGGLCLLAGTVLAFIHFGTTVGLSVLGSLVILTPVSLYMGFKIFPKSRMGKGLVLSERQKRESGFTSFNRDLYSRLEGADGEAVTDFRPSGMVRIEGKKLSAVTSGEYIEKGIRVRVIKVEGSRIIVREKKEN